MDTIDSVNMAQAKMAILWDRKHRPPNLTGKVYIKVAKQGIPVYHILGSSSSTAKKLGPFQIRRKIGNLASELDLPTNMRIHPVISVIHLKQAKEDEFERQDPSTLAPSLIIVDGSEQWVVEKIVRAEIRAGVPFARWDWEFLK